MKYYDFCSDLYDGQSRFLFAVEYFSQRLMAFSDIFSINLAHYFPICGNSSTYLSFSFIHWDKDCDYSFSWFYFLYHGFYLSQHLVNKQIMR